MNLGVWFGNMMGITMASCMRHAVTFEMPAAMSAHDSSDAASLGGGTPIMRIRGVS